MNREKLYSTLTYDHAVETLREIVSIPSISKSEQQLAEFLRDRCAGWGMDATIDAHGNMIARKRFSDDGVVFNMNSHMDTVPVFDGWTYPPFGGEMDGTLMYGVGVMDCKASIAGMMMAMEAILHNDVDLKGELVFTAVVCEEYPGESHKGTVRLINDGFKADMALIGEPTRSRICIGCQGMTEIMITTYGKAIHASNAEDGVNAINAMVKIIDAINARLKPGHSKILGNGNINVGVIEGGIRSSTVPDKCTLKVSKFVVEGETGPQFRDDVQALVNELSAADPTLNAKVELTYNSLAGVIEPDHPLTKHMENATAKVFGKPCELNSVRCRFDSDFLIYMAGIPALAFGPGDITLAHKENEWVDVADLPDAAKVYTEAILEILGNR